MISPTSLTTIGILLLALVTVESGGLFLIHVVRGTAPANALQRSFFRAGHAHAAVLLILSIAILSIIDHAGLHGIWALIGENGVPLAAILMSAGFFLSALGTNPTKPNKFIWLLWAGALSLTAGLLVSGIGLVVAGVNA